MRVCGSAQSAAGQFIFPFTGSHTSAGAGDCLKAGCEVRLINVDSKCYIHWTLTAHSTDYISICFPPICAIHHSTQYQHKRGENEKKCIKWLTQMILKCSFWSCKKASGKIRQLKTVDSHPLFVESILLTDCWCSEGLVKISSLIQNNPKQCNKKCQTTFFFLINHIFYFLPLQ